LKNSQIEKQKQTSRETQKKPSRGTKTEETIKCRYGQTDNQITKKHGTKKQRYSEIDKQRYRQTWKQRNREKKTQIN
jgi:hypothetical protein